METDHRASRTVLILAGATCSTVGAAALAGCVFHIPLLTRVNPSFNPIVLNTAGGLFLDGLALLFIACGRPMGALAGTVWSLLAGLLTLAEFIWSVDLHIDELFIRDYFRSAANPGRPAPNAALCLVLGGLALLLASTPRWRRRTSPLIGVLGGLISAIGLATVFGYLSGIPMYAWGQWKSMAAPAGIGFAAMGLGILALAWQYSQSTEPGATVPRTAPTWLAVAALCGAVTVALCLASSVETELRSQSVTVMQQEQSILTKVVLSVGILAGVLFYLVVNLALMNKSRAAAAELAKAVLQREIAEHKRAEEELVAAHRKNAAILESISDGFNAFDREWRYTYVNQPAARMVGMSPKELLGKVLWEMFPRAADSPFGAAYRRAVAENTPVEVEAFYPEPLNRWYHVRCYPSPEGVSIFFADCTERRHADERLRQTQKLESIGLLAGGVAHDFNNYLTVIMGSASSSLEDCPSCQHSQAVLAASQRAAYLTKQLLAYAGKAHNVTKLMDVTELVSQSKALLAASLPKRAALTFNLSKDLPCLEADPTQIEQILMNLVINAGEAIPPKADGLIEIATTCIEVTAETARLHSHTYDVAAGAYVCLEVRDNGTGMDESTISRIFDPFFTTKFTGRGLGLAAIQGIVRSAKGFVDVRSVPSRGTTFSVFLPASAKKRPAHQDAAKPLQILQLRRSGNHH